MFALLVSEASWGQYSIVHQFDPEVRLPRTTGVYQGQVYGLTDYYLTTDSAGQFVDNAAMFYFGLDGNNFRYENVINELGGFGPRELSPGPLAFDQGRLYGTQDLGTPYFASVTDLLPTRLQTHPVGTNWGNPIILGDNYVVGASEYPGYGISVRPLDGGAPTPTYFADTPTLTIASDGTNVFASSLGAPNLFTGKVASISPTGAINTLYSNESSTFGLAYSNGKLYGIGDDGLYRVNTDGTDFEFLKSDLVGTRIVVDDEKVYGVARSIFPGGSQPEQLFAINTDGSEFEVLHAFGIGNDGTNPNADLVVIGSSLFGSTYQGGQSGVGTYYRYDLAPEPQEAVPEPGSLATWFGLLCVIGGVRWFRVRSK